MTKVESWPLFSDIVAGRAPPPPAARLLGWRFISFDPAAGTLCVSFEAKDGFLNPAGIVQGGILAAMLDETMSPTVAAVAAEEVFAQTLEMKVSFLRPAQIGQITGEGRIVRRGREIAFLEGRLLDISGQILATASATARLISSSRIGSDEGAR